MAITVAEVINAARDLSELFDEDLVPSQTAMRYLSRYAHGLWERIVDVDPKRFEVCDNLLIADYFATDPPTPFTLNPALQYHGRKAYKDGTLVETEFAIVDPAEQVYPSIWPSGYIKEGDQLCLIGVERDWTAWTHVRVGYVPLFTDLADHTSNFDPLPDHARSTLEAACALFMARRVQSRKGAPSLADFRADARDAEDSFLRTIANQKTAEVGSIRPVW